MTLKVIQKRDYLKGKEREIYTITNGVTTLGMFSNYQDACMAKYKFNKINKKICSNTSQRTT